MKEKNIKRRAVFDIIPAGSLDNSYMSVGTSPEELDLKNPVPTPKVPPLETNNDGKGLDNLMSQILDGGVITPKEEIEALMSDVSDPVVELARAGAVIGRIGKWQGDLRTRLGESEAQFSVPLFGNKTVKQKNEEFYNKVVAKIREQVSRPRLDSVEDGSPRMAVSLASSHIVSRNIKSETLPPTKIEISPQFQKSRLDNTFMPESKTVSAQMPKPRGIIAEEVVSFYNDQPVKNQKIKPQAKKAINFVDPPKKRRTGWLASLKLGRSGWLSLLIIVGITAYGFTLTNELMQGGVSAFNNLEEAGQSLKSLNFSEASDNFGKSYQDFARASQTMNFMGASLAGIFSDLPGAGKFKSAKDMAEAGKLVAQSGQAMSKAMESLSHTGSILDPNDKNKVKPLKIITGLRDALMLSNNNFQKAKALIAGIDESIIPEDKKANFHDFKDKLPLLEEYLNNAVEYTEFLQAIVGVDEPKKYLLLFNNSSELRPTGGFPGTYGVVSFSSGGLADFFVNDVYNLDGQLKENIIPPKQLQHITPNWGMRDASWFFDFPTSAKKAMSFFSTEAGYKVDGVIALNPDIISGILSIVGPIQMPEYNLTLTADNFVENIQEEVEYGENRVQPKKVVVDFAPHFLEKLYSADSEKWMKIFNVIMSGLEEKDIMFYFNDKNSEDFTVKEGFGGEIKQISTGDDYLAVSLTNVKGSKTDAVTDSSILVDTRFEGGLPGQAGQIIHHVVLSRNHKGGDREHGFYNRQNPAYVRVLIPENSELLSISGNDIPNYHPIMNYNYDGSFEKDRDLAIFESGFYADKFAGVDRFEESGKKGIGFWMITNPGTTKKIEFEYSTPLSGSNYSFYFQKQPGLDWRNFTLKINESGNYVLSEAMPQLNRAGDVYIYDELLKKDFELKIKLKNK